MATVYTFTTPGSGSWTKPAGVTSILVECWGGGGGGANNPVSLARLPGGAGGQYASKLLTYSAASTESINYVVGASGSVGVNGGFSQWGTPDVRAMGGRAHDGNVDSTDPVFVPTGSTNGGIGDIIYKGGNANYGGDFPTPWAGGGGGGAGSTGDGNNATSGSIGGLAYGIGGVAKSENGGAGGNGHQSPSVQSTAGSNYGGGGGGGVLSYASKAGAQGYIRITTYTNEIKFNNQLISSVYFNNKKMTAGYYNNNQIL